MTPSSIIEKERARFSEHLEMSSYPSEMMEWVLAHKIVELQNHIQYLEARLQYESKR